MSLNENNGHIYCFCSIVSDVCIVLHIFECIYMYVCTLYCAPAQEMIVRVHVYF